MSIKLDESYKAYEEYANQMVMNPRQTFLFPLYHDKENFTELLLNDDSFNEKWSNGCTRDLTKEEIVLNPNVPKRIIID